MVVRYVCVKVDVFNLSICYVVLFCDIVCYYVKMDKNFLNEKIFIVFIVIELFKICWSSFFFEYIFLRGKWVEIGINLFFYVDSLMEINREDFSNFIGEKKSLELWGIILDRIMLYEVCRYSVLGIFLFVNLFGGKCFYLIKIVGNGCNFFVDYFFD